VCDQPKVVNRYNKLLNSQLHQQHTFKKFEEFEKLRQSSNMNEQSIINNLNKIDNSITNSILYYAENTCRKLKAGKVPYSPELSPVGKEINVWNNVLRKEKGCNISSTYIKRIAKKSNISHPMSLTIEDCIRERQSASKRYKKLNGMQSKIESSLLKTLLHSKRKEVMNEFPMQLTVLIGMKNFANHIDE